jgi:glucose-fructose oxidoreductase
MSSYGVNMNHLHVNYEKGWLKMEPHSSYNGNMGSLSDGTQIKFAVPNQQAKQMDEDCAAIMSKSNLLVPGEEGLRDTIIVEAIYKSVETGKQVNI